MTNWTTPVNPHLILVTHHVSTTAFGPSRDYSSEFLRG